MDNLLDCGMAPLSIDDELALARRRRRSTTCRAPLCCTATRPLRVSWWPFGMQVTVVSALNATTASRSPLPSPLRPASVWELMGAKGIWADASKHLGCWGQKALLQEIMGRAG